MSRPPVALCPHPPLLLPGLTGATDPVADLRAACRDAVGVLLTGGPGRVHLVGADGPSVDAASFAPGAHRPAATADRAGALSAAPLPLLVGRALLAGAGWTGPVTEHAVPGSSAVADRVAFGRQLSAGGDPVLVLGDGSARRGVKAPGYLDERAVPFDAAVLAALRAADTATLAQVDDDTAAELLAAGAVAWHVLAGLLDGLPPAQVRYADDPFGVAYVVATWSDPSSGPSR